MPDKPALYGCGSVQADAGGAAVPPGSFFADFPGFGVMGPLEKHRQEAHQTTEVVAFRGGRGCKSMCSLVSMLSIRSRYCSRVSTASKLSIMARARSAVPLRSL